MVTDGYAKADIDVQRLKVLELWFEDIFAVI